MPSDPPPLETLALVCPHCGGAFQVRREYRGMQVACPHCQQAIEVPRASGLVPPPPPAPDQPSERVAGVEPASPQRASLAGSNPATPLEVPAPPKPEPPRELTREERDRLRRRFRITVAVFAAVVLAIALVLLLQVE